MKTDLSKDLTILIAAKLDSPDRLKNLDITLDYLNHHFDVPIVLSEQDTEVKMKDICDKHNVQHIFYETDDFFNRQRGVNLAANQATTPVVAHYDADILLRSAQIKAAVDTILEGDAELVYPYDGKFYDVPEEFHDQIRESKSLDPIDMSACTLFNPHSVGGVVFFSTNCYWRNGGANENFKGLGYEDNEIYERFRKLGTKMTRLEWPLFHLTHERKDTSFNHNPHLELNKEEYFRIANMSPEELRKEVETWDWATIK